jgi:hypothetical protein
MSVQPRCSSACSIDTVTPNAGQDDDVVLAELFERLAGIAQEADAHRAQLIVDVRVMDDLAGQKHGAIGKAAARLVGVIDRPVDAVTEPELAREANRQPAGSISEVLRFDAVNQVAVIARRQHAGHGMLQVEALAEDDAGNAVSGHRTRFRARAGSRHPGS